MAITWAAVAQTEATALRELTVTSGRPLREIGIQRTAFDSLALKENIAQSMADVLTYNSSVFVKSHGRATMSTVAFRGTSAGHTQVSWNGLNINNPMLGTTDFSTIPAFFIDRASLLHGTSSVAESGGGLGGLVSLSTVPDAPQGVGLQYIQGIGSFSTFDEFLRLTYRNGRWTSSTRVAYSSSPNDYPYTNHDKKENIYDENHEIVGQYYPRERNRSGAFHDLHVMQEAYYDTGGGQRAGVAVWYAGSRRQLPLLTTDYADETRFDNSSSDRTLRAVASYDRFAETWNINLKAGYTHTSMAYDYSREVADGRWTTMTRSRSNVNTYFGRADAAWRPTRRWLVTASVRATQHLVRSQDKNVVAVDGGHAIVGYDKGRFEVGTSASVRWQPTDPLGISLVLRHELAGDRTAPLIPALLADYRLIDTHVSSMPLLISVKASGSRNYRFPAINDLYFLPGGNPSLRNESGLSYDCGADVTLSRAGRWAVDAGIEWFDSYIDNWILWLPTSKGYFSPRNVHSVHAYGIEARAHAAVSPARHWSADVNASLSWTPSVNRGPATGPDDNSVGCQLPYVPRVSASAVARLQWLRWAFIYKWVHYSERYTMSSNDSGIAGQLIPYYMNNVSLERSISLRPVDVNLKLAVNNLFNEDYVSVLSHPMPGINFEFFISLTPHF